MLCARTDVFANVKSHRRRRMEWGGLFGGGHGNGGFDLGLKNSDASFELYQAVLQLGVLGELVGYGLLVFDKFLVFLLGGFFVFFAVEGGFEGGDLLFEVCECGGHGESPFRDVLGRVSAERSDDNQRKGERAKFFCEAECWTLSGSEVCACAMSRGISLALKTPDY
jgi:hypothetical protein